MNGECGTFNPLLLDCLAEIAPRLKTELNVVSLGNNADNKIKDTVKQILKSDKSDASARSIRLLERERQKFRYLSDISQEIIFEYTAVPEILQLSEWGAEILGIPIRVPEPSDNADWHEVFKKEDFDAFVKALHNSTKESAVVTGKYALSIGGKRKWSKVIAKALWNDAEPPEFEGAIGKIVDVNDETEVIEYLERKADHDSRTGLLNHSAAKDKITKLLAEAGDKRYVLAVFDLDNFKQANDKYGHLFGDEVLVAVSDRVKANVRTADIAARIGGDEFMLFMEYKTTPVPQIDRIFKRLTEKYKDFDVRVSMGVALTEGFTGDYNSLFNMADAAMYTVKNHSKNGYCFYDNFVKKTLKTIKTDN